MCRSRIDCGSRGRSDARARGCPWAAAHADLAKATEARLAELLHFIHDAEMRQTAGRKFTLVDLQKLMRPRAQWLTEALEQLSQRRASSPVSLLHDTSLDRPEHDPGPWADVATFLRDIGHSSGWERIKAPSVPELLQRGRDALEAVLPQEMHRTFFQHPEAVTCLPIFGPF